MFCDILIHHPVSSIDLPLQFGHLMAWAAKHENMSAVQLTLSCHMTTNHQVDRHLFNEMRLLSPVPANIKSSYQNSKSKSENIWHVSRWKITSHYNAQVLCVDSNLGLWDTSLHPQIANKDQKLIILTLKYNTNHVVLSIVNINFRALAYARGIDFLFVGLLTFFGSFLQILAKRVYEPSFATCIGDFHLLAFCSLCWVGILNS